MFDEIPIEEFDEIIKSKTNSIVYISASWCPNCRTMTPVVHEVKKEYNSDVCFYHLNADSNSNLLKKLKVLGVPTTLYFSHGILVDRKAGALTKDAFKKRIEKLKNLSLDEAKDKELKGFFKWFL